MILVSDVLRLTEQLIAFAVLLQSIEYFKLRNELSDSGIWSWLVLKSEFEIFPRGVRRIMAFTLAYPNVVFLVSGQIAFSVVLLFFSHSFILGVLFLISALMSMRFRGTFNGGSDYMTLIILAALFVARSFPSIQIGAIYYIAIQTSLSYFIAGLVKLSGQPWRSGQALQGFLQITNFDVPARIRGVSQNPKLMLIGSWTVILFECLFPLCILHPGLCIFVLAMSLIFHLANFYIFGLNRFVFAWLASYPSLLYCSILLWQ